MAAYPAPYLAKLFGMTTQDLEEWAFSHRGRHTLRGVENETQTLMLEGPSCAAEFRRDLICYLSTGGR